MGFKDRLMAAFTNISPGARRERYVNAFAYRFNYKEFIPNPEITVPPLPDIPNPQSKVEFAAERVLQYIADIKKGVDQERAQATAMAAAQAAVITGDDLD